MRQRDLAISRRRFLSGSAVALAAARAAAGARSYETIRLAASSALPVKTAASELSQKTGATIRTAPPGEPIAAGEIVLAAGEEIRTYPKAAARLPEEARGKEWELVVETGGGLLIAGATPRNVCRAALGWIADPERETNRVSVYRFTERFTMWDNALNQMYAFSKGFDRRRHIREIARLGHTGVEINRYSYPGGYWVRHRKFPHDSYTWYLSYAPALDAFVESSLTRGCYPREELEANLADLREAAGIARDYGLEPGFVCYEPRCVTEAIFDRHPHLRGSRVDHPGRSLEPRFNLDIAHPKVLEHYAEMLENLMKEIPDLRYLVFWTEDSGSGIPFTRGLYPGPNGSYRARASTVGRMVADFSGALLEAGRKINPKFEVLMEIGWEYSKQEREEIIAALPEGVGVSHTFGGFLFRGGTIGNRDEFVRYDRAQGIEPYAAVIVSGLWEQAPILGIGAPSVLVKKFAGLDQLQLKRIFTHGGIVAPPQCPYNINQEVYAELIRGRVDNLDALLLRIATNWCEGDVRAATLLVEAWKTGERAMARWPALNWYLRGSGQTQARWITRPVVPDISKLDAHERSAWERAIFTLPADVARLNISFEGGIRMYTDEQLERVVREYDEGTLPLLAETVGILERACKTYTQKVLVDQHDRYRGLLYRERTVRNLFESQVAINKYLLKKGDPEAERQRLRRAIEAEIRNTEDWLRLLRESKTYFFRVAETETPFLYKTPVADLEIKLAAMQAHIDDEPGPFVKELTEELTERKLLFYF